MEIKAQTKTAEAIDGEKIAGIPYHLGIILDGNRRWAKENGLPFLEGHLKGEEKVKEIGEYARERGVKILTLYAFSAENWNRSQEEVKYLMKLLARAFSKKQVDYYNKEGIKLQVIGQKDRLPEDMGLLIKEAEDNTANNTYAVLNLAISYGGRPEIAEAVKKIVKDGVPAESITEDLIGEYLWTGGLPDPDLIIRPGGEKRLSGFLTWQSTYSELYFCDTYWPAFEKSDLDAAFEEFARRARRYGR